MPLATSPVATRQAQIHRLTPFGFDTIAID
jgi:hypothetical protein